MSENAQQIHEYRHRNGEDSISVRVGSESDLAFAGESDWQLVETPSKAAKSKAAPKASDAE